MKLFTFASRFLFSFLFAGLLLVGTPVLASGGGGGAAALAPIVLTVNVGENKYLQVHVHLTVPDPKASALVTGFMPRIQHELIYLLTEVNIDTIRTREGKRALMDSIQETINQIIGEDDHTGVTEVLFPSFIIQ